MNKVMKPKLFLETTIFNFFFYEKGKEKQVYTRKLFEAIQAGEYQAFTSEYVVSELVRDTKEKAENMTALIKRFNVTELTADKEIEGLAQIYIDRKIIPANYPDDALHIATATVCGLDCVVSYNMGHIVKSKTMIGTGFINKREGYLPVIISTPKEVIEYDQRRTTR
jgi:predicted nucleic acid-binding protein